MNQERIKELKEIMETGKSSNPRLHKLLEFIREQYKKDFPEEVVKTKETIILTFEFDQINSTWTGRCRELGTATFGNTLESALGNLREAVLLHLNTLTEVGEVWNFLKENKVTIAQEKEPLPVKTNEQPVWELVIEDMKHRDNFGRQKYGTPLQVSNGRDSLIDAYQEALDLVVYLRQEIERRKS